MSTGFCFHASTTASAVVVRPVVVLACPAVDPVVSSVRGFCPRYGNRVFPAAPATAVSGRLS
jgi:hypothetical protein